MTIRFFRQSVGEDMVEELTRAEVKDRLTDWVVSTEVAVAMLEDNPGETYRLTAFAFYWSEDSTKEMEA